jgi:hypothetical protein
MNWLSALLIILALAGCAQAVADTAPYAPSSPQSKGTLPEHGGGDGGGGM